MLNYIRQSLRRKKARRVTQEYPPIVKTYHLENLGPIEFANWDNPLAPEFVITQSNVDFFSKFIKEGDLVIDIGANFGDTTVPMGLSAGVGGLTLGFDPNPYVFKILEKNSSLNYGKYNLVPLPYAISKEEAEFYFISSEASFANGGISPTKDSIHGKFIYPEKIIGIKLSDFLEKEYPDWMSKLSFIKIDTEGYDKEIIKSISDLLAKYKPTLVAESFTKNSDAEKIELYSVIEDLGYDIYYFSDFVMDAKVVPLKSKSDITLYKQTINIYATPKP